MHAVLMGDPTFFSIRAGLNPHTRTRWGLRKRVDRARAIEQWHELAQRLEEHGVTVFVIPPERKWPGLVYPANAGFCFPQEVRPGQQKRFYLSNLVPGRHGERPIYESFVSGLGLATQEIPHRFEGEADFFPCGARYIFTYGRVVRQHFELRLGLPPYRRVYGFRSEVSCLEDLRRIVEPREVLPLELTDEAYYHGDTALCSFGPERRFLLVFLPALTPSSRERLLEALGDRVIPLSEDDAAIYAANSFAYQTKAGDQLLFMPRGTSERLQAEIRHLGVTPVAVDASEFLAKGGGSVKCMICDLGELGEAADPEVESFRAGHRYRRNHPGRGMRAHLETSLARLGDPGATLTKRL